MDEFCLNYVAFVLINYVFFLLFPENAGHCSVVVSAETDVRWFLKRNDEDQQLFGKCVFPCLFLLL